MSDGIRDEIHRALNSIVDRWPNESYASLSIKDKGFLMAHGECLAFAKEAVEVLDKTGIVSSKDITVVKWINEHKRALVHVFMLIHGRIYDSYYRSGYEATREALNTIFLRYAAESKLVWGDCGIIVEEETNKVLYNPWPREGIVLIPYTEMRINGSKFLKK